MIEVKNLYKSFDNAEVLKNISAQFEPGKINLIIGSSGHGKSVLMKSMVGLIQPDSGDLFYDGRDFLNLNYAELRGLRREIGMLFQGNALFDSLTVEENIGFPLKMFTSMHTEEIAERVNFCLKRVALDNKNEKYPAEISGGMKKRVGIARAIALDIKYLFADEPNSGLDPITSRKIDALLKDITEEYKITTIINTHDMKTVTDIGDKIVFIYHGENIWHGSRNEIQKTEQKIVKTFIKSS
ncbi:MAG: ABC transporter ATP-binding protein [Bacteroidetes bacterium MED-G17]|nr:MAG: ABC transporter ATP-binding protein [Bacteroidetes bacterium MED-G17]|tara:strand:- start:6529 stop:7251 length:723 start_codon:yes stop_codon:yes gene_type:complete